MNEHKTTFNYIQYGNVRRATLVCSACELRMEIDCLKTSTRVAEAKFRELHEESSKKPRSVKKSELTELRDAVQKETKKKSKKAEINDPELPEAYQ